MSFWKQLLQISEESAVNQQVTAPKTLNTIQALWNLQKIILDTLEFDQVVQKIVDGLLSELGYLDLGYRIIVLTLVDEENQVLKRISLSRTEEAKKALDASAVPFHEIDIPLNAHDNLLIKALDERRPLATHNWHDLFRPVLSEEEALRNQEASGIKTSMVYPLIVRDKVIGVLIFSMIKDESDVTPEEKDLIRGFTDIVGLAVQNSHLYSSLDQSKRNLETANERLKELDVLKNEFVSVASHELRTPMTAIKSYLWMALEGKGGPLTEKQKYYIDRAYVSVDRLIKMVNDMLNISRIESGRLTITMQPVEIDKLVQEVLDDIQPRAVELGVSVVLQRSTPPPTVLADPDKIKEVVFNLVGNSLKFTPSGGKITVSFEQTDTMVAVKVVDTGSGIEAEDIPKLFQKFGLLPGSYVTNQAALGTGLGLYICKSIIELHEGKIAATSPGRGKGSEFTFSLKIFNEADMQRLSAKYAHDANNAVDLIHSQV